MRRARLLLPIAAALALGTGTAQAAPLPATTQSHPSASMPADLATALSTNTPPVQVAFGQIAAAADAGSLRVAVVDSSSRWVAATDASGNVVAARAPAPERGKDWGTTSGTAPARSGIFGLLKSLRAHGVTIITFQGKKSSGGSGAPLGVLLSLLPLFVIGGFLLFRTRKLRGAGAGKKDAGATPVAAGSSTTFGDVAGCDEVVGELREIVEFLEDPDRFEKVGAKMPRGVILHGPPGTGKTLLARAVAGEAGVPFYAASGSEFVEKYVGVGASRVRDMFAKATAHPEGAVVFIDEIDAIGRKRSASGAGNDGEREGTLNQLLVAMDGFTRNARVVVVAATNRIDMLDDALLRPGRFDRHVRVDAPNERGRLAILLLHASNKPVESPAALERLARVSAGASGATLELMLNEAAIMAARERREIITSADLAEGQLRALAGPQRADTPYTPDERRRIAWHEAGHALAAELCPTHDNTQRVTILARGQAGGLALYGQKDRMLHSPQDLHERCVVTLAGRAAEELHFGGVSSGASNDLEVVNSVVRAAVCELGFSPVFGQLVAPARHGGTQILSENARQVVDEEVRRLIDKAYQDALELLHAHLDELGAIANALLSREQLDREDLDELLESLTPRRAPEQAVAQLATARERRRHAA